MVHRLALLLVAPGLVAAGFVLPTSADAGFVTPVATQGGSAQAGVTYSTFDGQALGMTNQTTSTGLAVALAGGAAFVNGSVTGQYAAPNFSGSNNQYFYPNATNPTPPANGTDATNYLASVGGTITFTNGNGGSLGNYFGLLWGSVDTFNSITFNFADGSASATLTGALPGVVADGTTTYYVNFTATTAISSVVATSRINSFEIDNVAFGTAAVPEPASLAMVGIGLAGIGLVARRRRV